MIPAPRPRSAVVLASEARTTGSNARRHDHAPPSSPISALPEIRELIDGAEGILKADISRIKRLLADPAATLPLSIVAFTLQEAKDALDLLAVQPRQLKRWQKDTITDAERAEIERLQSIIPEIRPLISAAHLACDRAG